MQTVSEILEWPQVLAHLESCCQTGYGRLLVNADDLLTADVASIQREMARVEEAKTLIQRYGDVPLSEPPDVMALLQRLGKGGDIQSPEELSLLLIALRALRQLARFFIQHRSREKTPILLDELEAVTLPNTVIERLEGLVSEKGELLHSASESYGRLKTRIQETRAGIRQYLQQLMGRPTISRYLQEPLITEREGRSVLPVKAEHKVDVPGIVHDTSSTGITLYIEPKGVIEQNNRLVALRGELEQEIRRILRDVSQALHPEISQLQQFVSQVAQLDLLMAKARQSLILKANPVEMMDAPGELHLRQARHPLLMLQLDSVVPNDIMLHPPHRVMLITGPNTGGKTILLKLIGLFALMARAGLHLPVAEGSRMSLFAPILADIGDPQSITQSLSTFSGHIARLKAFLQEPDLSLGLVLVDEICAGTDPQEGSALAQAILETFYHRGATVIVTTHIGELKVFAHQRPGYLNASVEFDPHSLSPTYRLLLGIPGTSNALNIAATLGLPSEVIELAKTQLSKPASDSAHLIESLESKNRQLTQELEEARKLREEIQWEEEQMRNQLNRIEGEKKKVLQMYREGLKDKLRGIEQEVDDLRKDLKQQHQPQDRKSLQNLSGRFRHVQSQTGDLFAEEREKLYPKPDVDWDKLKVGDVVESRSLSLSGTVIEKHPSRQEVTLQSGILKTTVPFSDIVQKVGRQSAKTQPLKSSRQSSQGSTYTQARSLSVDCDIRGFNSEEGIAVMEKSLDEAMVSGVATVNVIHGLGTGALKKAVRNHLQSLPYVKRFGPAPANEGGDGKTIVEL